MKQTLLIFYILLMSTRILFSQSETFTKVFFAEHLSASRGGIVAEDNSYIAAGLNYQFEGIDTIINCDEYDGDPFDTCFQDIWQPDVYVVKINESGDSIWENNIGDQYYETCEDIIMSNDGNYILVGCAFRPDDSVTFQANHTS